MIRLNRIRNTIITLLLSMILALLVVPATTLATDEPLWEGNTVPSTRQKDRLVDKADLLTDDQEKDLLDTLDSISRKWNCSICVLTVDSIQGDVQAFADDYYDYNGMGAEFDDSGFIMVISMEDRDWVFSSDGYAKRAITDYGRDYIVSEMMDNLRSGNYYEAFNDYAEAADYLLKFYDENGTAYDVGYKPPKTTADRIRYLFYSLGIGLLIALFPILSWKADLKTVKMNNSAANYRAHNGLNLRVHTDRFINKTVTRTAIPKSDDSSRGGGYGGTSIHTSSSGHSHGGGHGHF
jgi:uncharacterized protein